MLDTLDTKTSLEAGTGQIYVTLSLADQPCGISVHGVRDILADQVITRIPLAAREIAGSLNLRGRIVTAIDLRARLGLPPRSDAAQRMSVVVEQGAELYALLVDSVSEVVTLDQRTFERNPPTLTPNWSQYSLGIHRLEGRLLVLLDIPKLLALGEPL